jgi:hypothetical protein
VNRRHIGILFSTYTQDLGRNIVLISGGFGFQVVAVRRTRLHYALEIYGPGP